MEKPAKILATIFEKKNKELINLNEWIGVMLIQMNNYDEAVNYFESLLFISNNADLLLALSYCKTTASVPKLVCIINNKKIIDELRIKNNIKCFDNVKLTNEIYNECELFDTIPGKYWKEVAEIFVKIINQKE